MDGCCEVGANIGQSIGQGVKMSEASIAEICKREKEKFFADYGPEKLPPMSGPVTMEDGTVLVPHDPVCHPSHYVANGPTCTHCGSNIECITITERMGFCLGNTVKYIWRKDAKGKALEDLKKARWYLDREIERMEANCEQ